MWKIEADNGNTKEITITDKLIDSEELAKYRGCNELIKRGYKQVRCKLKLAKVQDVENMFIGLTTFKYAGKTYLLQKTKFTLKGIEIEGVRYE